MQVTLLYFASLREQVSRSREVVDLPPQVQTVGALRQWLRARGEPFASAMAQGKAVRVAVNQQMAQDDQSISGGVEVACFPPVTGG